MTIHECLLETMERVFYASSELGDEYRTADIIANTALPYALHFIPPRYKLENTPNHQHDLTRLRDQGIYVTPATFIPPVRYVVEYFNGITEGYNATISSNERNLPTNGRIRCISAGNSAVFFVFSANSKSVTIPGYIRVGKWMSKCKVTSREIGGDRCSGEFFTPLFLRAIDLPPAVQLISGQRLSIQHGIYFRNTTFRGDAIELPSRYWQRSIHLPRELSFYAASND